MNNQVDSRDMELIRSRVQQIREESPWMEAYEVEAIVCSEFGLNDFDSSSVGERVVEKPTVSEQDPATKVIEQSTAQQTGGAKHGRSKYYEIQRDAIGKFDAYEGVSSKKNRRDVATRALYDLAKAAENDKEAAAIVAKARAAISEKIKSESDHVGVALIISILMQLAVGVGLAVVAVLVFGMNLDEVYGLITKPSSMALLHAGILLIAYGFPFIVYIYIHKLPTGEIVPLHHLRKGELWPMVGVGLALMMVKGCLENYINYPGAIRGGNYSYEAISFGSTTTDMILTFVCMGVLPAMIETFAFNGVILQVMRRRGGDGFALLFSSVLYAIMTANFVEMPGAFITSLLLGYMVIFSGSLVPAVITRLIERILFFVITQLGFFVSDSTIVQYIDCFVTIVLMGVGILSFFVLVQRFPELFVVKRSDPCLTTSQKMGIAITRTPIIIIMVLSVCFAVIQIFELTDILDYAGKIINA